MNLQSAYFDTFGGLAASDYLTSFYEESVDVFEDVFKASNNEEIKKDLETSTDFRNQVNGGGGGIVVKK
jgi:hypothetical protein